MSGRSRRRGEFDLISKYFAPLAEGEAGALSLLDDAAVLKPGAGSEFVVTTDAVVAGVHFFPDDPAGAIAQKALRVNLSDLAAKGARPRAYLLTAVFPREVDEAWVRAFAAGLKRDQAAFGMTLIGGDTTATPGPLTLNIVALGEVAQGKMLLRSDARAGDDVWVSGTIGDAFLGLKCLRDEKLGVSDAQRRAVIGRYRLPVPRVAVGQGLIGLATACVDVSDGLVADLGHIAKASKVAIRIEGALVPLSAAANGCLRSGAVSLAELVTGGDDYELAFTAPVGVRAKIEAIESASRVALTRIGKVAEGKGVTVLDDAGRAVALDKAGYTHF